MKKFFLCIAVIMLLFFTGCEGLEQNVYNVTQDDETYTVDIIERTITCKENVYKYDLHGKYEIIYPNGAVYTIADIYTSNHGTWSGNEKDEKYDSPNTLKEVLSKELSKEHPEEEPNKNIFIIIILLILGIWNVVSPKSSWYVSHGWKYKDAEPSEMALVFTVVGGIAAIIVAVVLMFI